MQFKSRVSLARGVLLIIIFRTFTQISFVVHLHTLQYCTISQICVNDEVQTLAMHTPFVKLFNWVCKDRAAAPRCSCVCLRCVFVWVCARDALRQHCVNIIHAGTSRTRPIRHQVRAMFIVCTCCCWFVSSCFDVCARKRALSEQCVVNLREHNVGEPR